jgi:hypothetical protein
VGAFDDAASHPRTPSPVLREHRARLIGPASALDKQADRRPCSGKPIRCPLVLATLAHDALAGTELDELRHAERIDLWAGAALGS